MDKKKIAFIKSIKCIGTSKFTTATYKENIQFKQKYKKTHHTITTLLNPICDKFTTDEGIFILEMNNETNEIEGIGIIKNFPIRSEECGLVIYSNNYYNSYVYHGPYHISREQILKNKNIKPLKYLENLVFKGSKHLKRGWNSSCFSLKNERIITSPPYEEFVCEKDKWDWKNKKKGIRRCSICYHKKDENHRKLNKNKPGCNLKPISKSKRCNYCGEIKLSHPWRDPHICSKIKKHPENLEIINTFLQNLFIITNVFA